MVVQAISDAAPINHELLLDSGRSIQYVAAKSSMSAMIKSAYPRRKNSNGQKDQVGWEGVSSICSAMDHILEIDMDSDFFERKSVLEVGFTTALPAVYAFENGASDITIHAMDEPSAKLYCDPTVTRNKIPKTRSKVTHGSIEDIRHKLSGKKFDVIIAVDVLNRDKSEFNVLHEVLNEILADDGIILLSCHTYYPETNGTLAGFLHIVKSRHYFDAIERWTSPETDILQKKVYQLTRSRY